MDQDGYKCSLSRRALWRSGVCKPTARAVGFFIESGGQRCAQGETLNIALERIGPTVLAQPLRDHRGQRQPASGDTVRLAFREAAGDDLLVTGSEDAVLRLKGLGHMAAGLKAGEVLLMRVLATEPQLMLRLVNDRQTARDFPPVSPSVSQLDTPAMRVDQLALQRMLPPAPDVAALARAWHAQVHASLQRQAVIHLAPEPAPGTQLMVADRWSFPAFAWAGIPVLLRLVQGEEENRTRKRAAGHRQSGLWFEFELPAFGRLALRLRTASDGIFLLLAAQSEDALRQVRAALPAIARALAAVKLHLRRCELSLGLPDPAGMRGWSARSRGNIIDAPPLALFRAAGEIMAVLTAMPPEANVRPAGR